MYSDYGYYTTYGGSEEELVTGILAGGLAIILISLVVAAFTIVCNWLMFKKAKKGGWEAIVPGYNMFVTCQLFDGNGWHLFFLLIPIYGFIYGAILLPIKMAKSFGKGGGFAAGLIFLGPIFQAILAFNKNIQYVGPNGVAVNDQPQVNIGQVNDPQPIPAEPATKVCPTCGTQLNANDTFCTNCGTRF